MGSLELGDATDQSLPQMESAPQWDSMGMGLGMGIEGAWNTAALLFETRIAGSGRRRRTRRQAEGGWWMADGEAHDGDFERRRGFRKDPRWARREGEGVGWENREGGWSEMEEGSSPYGNPERAKRPQSNGAAVAAQR